MENGTPRPLNEKGWTLIELMLVVALIAIITPAMTYLFMKVQQGMAADEMHLQLQALNEQTLMRLHERLVANRHMFQGDSSGISFLGAVTTGMSAATKAQYPILPGTLLAQAQPATLSGSFSPVTAVRADFGNSLLFGAYDSPQTIGNQIYNSPATIAYSAANNFVTYGDGTPATVVIDLYRFYYYYLTAKNPMSLRNASTYRLVEWQSIQYADYYEIQDISDSVLSMAVIQWLSTPGYVSPQNPAYAVTWAWDPTQSDPNQAFYTLAGGNANAVNPFTQISEGPVTALTKVSSGILSAGFFYGISPNSSIWNGAPVSVPQFALASGSFPGGFETGISGTSAGREVMVRSLLVAQGSAPKIIWNDQTIVTNAKDNW